MSAPATGSQAPLAAGSSRSPESSRPVALVTGGSSGIGAASVRALARDGFDVIVHYGTDAAGAEESARAARRHGAHAVTLRCDLARVERGEEFWAAVRGVAGTFGGGLGALVLNAGIDDRRELSDFDGAEIHRVLQVNAVAPALILQDLSALSEGASVVVVSSVAVRRPILDSIPYGMSKAAVEHLVQAVARTAAAGGLRVNAVAPGAVDTPLQDPRRIERLRPSGIVAAPEDIAEVVAFLAGPRSHWIHAQVIDATGRPLSTA